MQVTASTGSSQGSDHQMPQYNLPSQILCRVMNLSLSVSNFSIASVIFSPSSIKFCRRCIMLFFSSSSLRKLQHRLIFLFLQGISPNCLISFHYCRVSSLQFCVFDAQRNLLHFCIFFYSSKNLFYCFISLLPSSGKLFHCFFFYFFYFFFFFFSSSSSSSS